MDIHFWFELSEGYDDYEDVEEVTADDIPWL